MNRIFISYRNSDGFKDANRLAVDLNRVFGKDQVFLDKQDLRGGSSWRDEIMAALGAKPVVLALITPDYLGAIDGNGRRIDHEDDPVREELFAALDANARIIPLLSETVKMPVPDLLPARLQPITGRHALKLRSEDWNNDLPRLIDDLIADGVKVKDPDWRLAFGAPPLVRAGRWVTVAVTAFIIVLGLELIMVNEGPSSADDYVGAGAVSLMPLAASWYAWRTLKGTARKFRITALIMSLLVSWQVLHMFARAMELQRATSLSSANAPAEIDLSGVWDVEMVDKGPLLPFTLTQSGANVKLETERFQADKNPNVAAMNKIAKGSRGPVLTVVRLKGSGALNGRELNALMNYVTGPEEIAFATGTLTAKVDESNRSMHGEMLFIGDQKAIALKLTRRER
jgi:hypothetical protein